MECDPHLSVVRQLIEVAPQPTQVAQLRWIEVAQCKITPHLWYRHRGTVAQCKITPHLWHTCTVHDLQKSTTFVSGSHLIPHGFHPMRFYKQSAPTIWGNIRAFHQLGLKHHLLNFLDTKFDCRHM